MFNTRNNDFTTNNEHAKVILEKFPKLNHLTSR